MELRIYERLPEKISNEVPRSYNFLRKLSSQEIRTFMKQGLLVKKRERLNAISETKPNTVHLK